MFALLWVCCGCVVACGAACVVLMNQPCALTSVYFLLLLFSPLLQSLLTGLFTTFVFSEPLTILLLEALLPIVAYDLFNPPTRSALSDDTPKVKSRTGDPEGAPWWRWWRVCV